MPQETPIVPTQTPSLDTGGLGIPAPAIVDLPRESAPIIDATEASTETVVVPPSRLKPATQDENTARVSIDDVDGELPSMDDFLGAKAGLPPKEAVKPKVEEPKTKLEELPVKPDAAPVVTPKDGKVIPHKVERDYSGFEAPEVEALKRMSNEAFEYVRPRLLENKQLGKVLKDKDTEIATLKSGKQMLPDSYYEHPQGFIFSQDYNREAQNLDIASNIRDHWQSQLVAIRKGEPYIPIVKIDERTGQLVYGKPIEGGAEDEFKVMGYFNGAANQMSLVQNNMNRIQNEFAGRHKSAADGVNAAIKQHFSVYEDPKHPMQPVIKSLEAAMPKEFSGSPMYKFGIYAATAALQYGEMIKNLSAEIAELKKNGAPSKGNVSSAQAKAGPTDSDSVSSATSKGVAETPEVTMEDFERVKRGD